MEVRWKEGKVEEAIGHEKVQLQDEGKEKGASGALYSRVHGHLTNLCWQRGFVRSQGSLSTPGHKCYNGV
jgi:hypothetical protein